MQTVQELQQESLLVRWIINTTPEVQQILNMAILKTIAHRTTQAGQQQVVVHQAQALETLL